MSVDMPSILLVEDSKTSGAIIKKKLEKEAGFQVVWALSRAQALKELGSKEHFFLAVSDLNLPDSLEGEIVDVLVKRSVPVIVLTGDFDKRVREWVWSRDIIDYVWKMRSHSTHYVVWLAKRIWKNQFIKILVVDDSQASRSNITGLLKTHQYQVLEASSGIGALEALEEHPDIRLMTIDYNMSGMDAFGLIDAIRNKKTKEELAIIGLSTQRDPLLAAGFMKAGANDFVRKPFLSEEFYGRVNQNVEMVERVLQISETSNRDYLTKLHNRRYLFELGKKLFASAKRGHITLTAALLDIDHFKQINDTHGHDVGDLVLSKLGQILANRFRETDIVARYGGEEFCILLTNMAPALAQKIFDELRMTVEETQINAPKVTFHITISIGVASGPADSLNALFKRADELLYEAKEAGRNRVATDWKSGDVTIVNDEPLKMEE